MPPFRAGLIKRKIENRDNYINSKNSASDDEAKEDSDEATDDSLLPGELNLEGDSSDSEHEDETAQDSDHERDEVLYGDDDDSTLGDDEQVDDASDESSALTDSEADDAEDSDEEGSEEGSEEQDDDSGGEESEARPGIAHALSGGSDAGGRPDVEPRRRGAVTPTAGTAGIESSIDRLAVSVQDASGATRPVAQKGEYSSGDSSDEEQRVNTAGAVPAWWYRDYPHVGYDLDGRRILRPPQRDRIDDFLKQCSDPEFWRTVRDPATGQDVVLSAADLDVIARLRAGHVPDAAHDDYKPWIEWFTSAPLACPVRAFPDHKRSFLPSRADQRAVQRIVHALRMGWVKTRRQLADERRRNKEKKFYNLWGSSTSEEEQKLRGVHAHIPAPRRPPPSHAESYNPPPEYLLDHKELKEWEALAETPWKRKYTFLPEAHGSLRAVSAYPRFVRERFLRCLDLYLAPRAVKMRLTLRAEELVPRLPAPRDLQPFPTAAALTFRGHAAPARSAGFDPSGQYVVSGSDDGTLKVWESATGRCLRTILLGAPVARVAWTPAAGLSLVAAAAGARLLLLNPGAGVGAHRAAARTDRLLEEPPPATHTPDERTAAAARWERVAPDEWARGVRLAVTHFKPVVHVAWHARGDYLCVTLSDAASRSVVVHQVSRRRSQLPFSRAKGLVQCAVFHPTKPTLFVATQRCVRVYDLVKQELVRKLLTGAQWVSDVAVHPRGDNLLVGSYDRKLAWFDLELSAKPYQTLRLHAAAVRSVAFHARYPLFASAGDDHAVLVCHGMVYNDLLQNPLLVPLKALRFGERRAGLCVLQLAWHPAQPWLLAAGADGTLRLFS